MRRRTRPIRREPPQAPMPSGGHDMNVTLPTDRAFCDHRIALKAVVFGWLEAFPRSGWTAKMPAAQ